jgi:apolipoprotein N-acyltransferase
MICGGCQGELAPQARFCQQCGRPTGPTRDSELSSVARLWRGRVAMPRAFWIWGVSGCSLILLVSVVLLNSDWSEIGALLATAGAFYCAFVCVAVWRSAATYDGPRLWPVLARGVTILTALLALYVLLPAPG